MQGLKRIIPFIPGAAIVLIDAGLQLSGYQNVPLAVGLWSVAAISLGGAACHQWHDRRKRRGMAGLDSLYFVVPTIIVGVIAIALAMFGLELHIAKSTNEKTIDTAPAAAAITIRPYLKNIHVFAGSSTTDPRFDAKFTRNGGRGRLFADDSYFISGLGNAMWTARRRIFIAEVKDFVAEQPFNVPILTSVPSKDDPKQKMWRWGDGTTAQQTIYSPNVFHRGRMVFIPDDGPPEYFYFIIPQDPPTEPPHLLDRQYFDFAKEWEAEDEQKPN
jgi:hypothetical protein